jgi:hypothetical protein
MALILSFLLLQFGPGSHVTLMKVKSAVIGSYLTGDKYKISQKCKVTPDPDDMNGWLRVIEMKRLKPKQILPCDSTTYMWQRSII